MPGERYSIDVVEPLPPSQCYKYIFNAVENFSRYLITAPFRDKTAESVAIIDKIIIMHSCPNESWMIYRQGILQRVIWLFVHGIERKKAQNVGYATLRKRWMRSFSRPLYFRFIFANFTRCDHEFHFHVRVMCVILPLTNVPLPVRYSCRVIRLHWTGSLDFPEISRMRLFVTRRTPLSRSSPTPSVDHIIMILFCMTKFWMFT